MKINKELIFSVVIFIAGAFFGLIFSSLFDISVESTINISDLLSVGVTISLGIYLGITITSRQSSSRFEKEFLIGEVKRITDYIDSDFFFKNTSEISHEEAKRSFKNLNIVIFNFESILSDANYSSQLNGKPLRNSFKQFRASVLNISPQNNLIKPNIEQRQIIINKYGDLRREVFKMITSINKHGE